MPTTPLPLTLESERILRFANEEAQRLGHEYIGTEHVLMGVTQELTGIVARIVEKHQLTLAHIHAEVMKCIQCFEGTVTADTQLPLTPRADKVLKYADEEAYALGHMHVGIHHILLGLLRECEGIGAQVLMNFGLRLEDIRDEILRELAPPEEERILIGTLEIPNPNASRPDDSPSSPNGHMEAMKAFVGKPHLSDDELVELFERIVTRITEIHLLAIASE